MTSAPPDPRDPPPGLQHERTTLAWQRTGLALLACGAALTRLVYADLGPWSLVCLGLIVVLVAGLSSVTRALGDDSGRVGVAALITTCAVLVLGATELIRLSLGS